MTKRECISKYNYYLEMSTEKLTKLRFANALNESYLVLDEDKIFIQEALNTKISNMRSQLNKFKKNAKSGQEKKLTQEVDKLIDEYEDLNNQANDVIKEAKANKMLDLIGGITGIILFLISAGIASFAPTLSLVIWVVTMIGMIVILIIECINADRINSKLKQIDTQLSSFEIKVKKIMYNTNNPTIEHKLEELIEKTTKLKHNINDAIAGRAVTNESFLFDASDIYIF
jgi:exonuclease VII large subunit